VNNGVATIQHSTISIQRSVSIRAEFSMCAHCNNAVFALSDHTPQALFPSPIMRSFVLLACVCVVLLVVTAIPDAVEARHHSRHEHTRPWVAAHRNISDTANGIKVESSDNPRTMIITNNCNFPLWRQFTEQRGRICLSSYD
jgi:hypothetical protein